MFRLIVKIKFGLKQHIKVKIHRAEVRKEVTPFFFYTNGYIPVSSSSAYSDTRVRWDHIGHSLSQESRFSVNAEHSFAFLNHPKTKAIVAVQGKIVGTLGEQNFYGVFFKKSNLVFHAVSFLIINQSWFSIFTIR